MIIVKLYRLQITKFIFFSNTIPQEIMMDHALRSISYIADIGDLLVIMARRRLVPPGSNTAPSAATGNSSDAATNASGTATTGTAGASSSTSSSVIPTSSASALSAACDDVQVIGTTPKMICHVFESEEVSNILEQSICIPFLLDCIYTIMNSYIKRLVFCSNILVTSHIVSILQYQTGILK